VLPHILAVPFLDAVDPKHLIEAFGVAGLFAIIFAESGLLIGFFLPGDSLLFTAGLLKSQGVISLPLPLLLLGCFVCAVAGDQVGYAFGRRVGPSLFRRPDSKLFKQEHVEKAQAYFDKHGSKTIVLARFIPIVRTFAPVLAGVGRMDYRTFVTYNVMGGLFWAVGVTTVGYTLGRSIPSIDKYLLPIIALIIFLSFVPVAVEAYKAKKHGAPGSVNRDDEAKANV